MARANARGKQLMNGRSQVVIVGGGPGGYEAALVAAHLGASVTVIDSDGLGGAAVLTDCVPSKTLISTADYLGQLETSTHLGVHLVDHEGDEMVDASANLPEVNARVLALAAAQSEDIAGRLEGGGPGDPGHGIRPERGAGGRGHRGWSGGD